MIIAIGGEPASGKTTLLKDIIKNYKPLSTFKFKLVRGLYNKKNNIYFIGIYDNSVFSGTDKLSMAVQPDFFKFLDKVKNSLVIFEGDRLFNQSLFNKYKCKIVVLKADNKTLEGRHILRSDNQTEVFKKAKKTKIVNIIEKNNVILYNNNTDEEYKRLKLEIINLIQK